MVILKIEFSKKQSIGPREVTNVPKKTILRIVNLLDKKPAIGPLKG